MNKNIILTEIDKMKLRVKKEHFWRIGLWTAGIVLTTIWLTMLIATSISSGQMKIWNKTEETYHAKSLRELGVWWNNNVVNFVNLDGNDSIGYTLTYQSLNKIIDINPLCLTYKSTLTGWYMLIVLAPVGYMGCIYIVAYMKNMITPQAVKRINRKALQFGYLKQKDVEYICNEIDYNVGLKQRPEQKSIEESKNEEYEFVKGVVNMQNE